MTASIPPSLILPAPAKVNLALHVTGRRADGYHELSSLMVFTPDIADTLHVEAAADFSLHVTGPMAAQIGGATKEDAADNLVSRAVHLLARHCGQAPHMRITLEKNLPVAAGLGGGSADAAAILRHLAGTWGADLTQGDLAADILKLGAEMPVCLHNAPALVEGIGEEITPLHGAPGFGVVLANPGIGLATPQVFARFAAAPEYSPPLPPPPQNGDAGAWFQYLAPLGNGLERAARALCPQIGTILEAMAADPSCRIARMSGSGATCFGLYESLKAAREAAGRLKAACPAAQWVAAGHNGGA